MPFDAVGFFQQYGIEYVESGHKHCRDGWVQTECPFCTGNPGYHLGFNLERGWWNCWRCGYHRLFDVLVALLGSKSLAKQAYHDFKGASYSIPDKKKKPAKELILPSGLQPLTKRARKYLESRNFDPDLLATYWNLQSTNNIGPTKFRIFIPIYLSGQMVSWQARDVTGNSNLRYLGQSQDKEIISNKQTLYGVDSVPGRSCVIVEGVTDVWRLGPGAVATFGIKYKAEQVSMLVRKFKTCHILYDPPDPQAHIQAKKLARDLSGYGREVVLWDAKTDLDPGDFKQDDADAFMRDTLGIAGY